MSTINIQTWAGLRQYTDTEKDTFTYEIGSQNGVLLIVRTRKVSTAFTVPDEEDVVRGFSPHRWYDVWRNDD